MVKYREKERTQADAQEKHERQQIRIGELPRVHEQADYTQERAKRQQRQRQHPKLPVEYQSLRLLSCRRHIYLAGARAAGAFVAAPGGIGLVKISF